MNSEAQIVAEAGRLCGLTLGQFTVLRRGERNWVIRAKVAGAASEVVIKAATGERHLLAQEAAALQRINDLPEARDFAPRLLAGDPAAGIVVMAAVSGAASLDDHLNGTDFRAATTALCDTAGALGRLHAVTARAAGRDDLALAKEQGDGFVKLEPAIREIFEQGGVTWPKEAGEEFLRIAHQLKNPGEALAFTVGDMAPSNVLVRGREIVFIDFEYAGYRHAFYDAMFWHCICPFPAALIGRLDDAYREGWAKAGRNWDKAAYAEGMALLAAHRALWSLTWNVKTLWQHDREMAPGVSGRKLVRNWLRGFWRMGRGNGTLPALTKAVEQLDHAMGEAWPESAGSISFPVFGQAGVTRMENEIDGQG